MLFALFLGLYIEGISYFFEKYFYYIDSLKMIIILTIITILLFILVFFISLFLLIKDKLRPKSFSILLIVNVIIGLPISLWLLFALVMGWG